MELNDFVQLLNHITSPDNALRREAEAVLEQMKQNPPQLCGCLLQTVQSVSTPLHLREMSSLLLRRMLVVQERSVYEDLTPEAQAELKTVLLHLVQHEEQRKLRTKLCEMAGELAGYVLDEEAWPEMMPFIRSMISSPNAEHRESALQLFGMVAGHFVPYIEEQYQTIAALLQGSLVDDEPTGRVRFNAFRALGTLLMTLSSTNHQNLFAPLLPVMLESLLSVYRAGESQMTSCIACLEILIEMAEHFAEFFVPHGAAFVTTLCGIAADTTTPEAIRRLSLEWNVSFAENAASQARKIKDKAGRKIFASTTLDVCVHMLVDLHDDPAWDQADTVEGVTDEVGNSDIGEQALDRICRALGQNSTLNIAFSHINTLFANAASDWKAAHAGLIIIACIVEITKKAKDSQEHRAELLEQVTPFLTHECSRVRAAALHVLSQLCVQHGPMAQSEHFDTLLHNILASLDSKNNPAHRVRWQASVALINFIDLCPGSLLTEESVSAILNAVVQVLREGPQFVQEASVGAITSVAEVGRDQVSAYYDHLMPLLKELLDHCMQHELSELYGKTLECVAIVGEASGKQLFFQDALQVMDAMLRTYRGGDILFSLERRYMLKAWVRIAKCLAIDFLPFLTMVVPPLMEAIRLQVEVDVEDGDMDDDSDIDEVEVDGGVVAIRTSAVEEQATGCQMMLLLAEALQQYFYPYVEETLQVLSELMKTSLHEDVRSYSMVAMPEFVRVVGKHTQPDRSSLQTVVEFAIVRLLEAIQAEPVMELIMAGIQALRLTIHYACVRWDHHLVFTDPADPTPATSVSCLNEAQMRTIVDALLVILAESIQRRAIRRAEATIREEVDEDDLADDAEAGHLELELHFNISDCFCMLMKTHGEQFVPVYVESLHQKVMMMASPECLIPDRQFAIWIVDDLIEHGGSAVVPLLEEFLQALLSGVVHEDPALRQPCAHGLGWITRLYGSYLHARVGDIINALVQCIQMGESPDEPRGAAVDNAVSALGVVCETLGSVIPGVDQIWQQWLGYLPLADDVEESRIVTAQLCRLVGEHNTALLGESMERLPQALCVLMQIVGTPLSSGDLQDDIVSCINRLRATVPAAAMEATWQAIPDVIRKQFEETCAQHHTFGPSSPPLANVQEIFVRHR